MTLFDTLLYAHIGLTHAVGLALGAVLAWAAMATRRDTYRRRLSRRLNTETAQRRAAANAARTIFTLAHPYLPVEQSERAEHALAAASIDIPTDTP